MKGQRTMIDISLNHALRKQRPVPGRCLALISVLIIVLFSIMLPGHSSAAENDSTRKNFANIWYFGDGAGLDFNAGINPTVLTDNVALNSGGSAVISDQEGNLLFYTDGTQIRNSEHAIMPRGSVTRR